MGKRNIFVCMSADLNQCELLSLLYHEVTHAIDFCNQPDGGAGINGENCKEKEEAAYAVRCKNWAGKECMSAVDQERNRE